MKQGVSCSCGFLYTRHYQLFGGCACCVCEHIECVSPRVPSGSLPIHSCLSSSCDWPCLPPSFKTFQWLKKKKKDYNGVLLYQRPKSFKWLWDFMWEAPAWAPAPPSTTTPVSCRGPATLASYHVLEHPLLLPALGPLHLLFPQPELLFSPPFAPSVSSTSSHFIFFSKLFSFYLTFAMTPSFFL